MQKEIKKFQLEWEDELQIAEMIPESAVLTQDIFTLSMRSHKENNPSMRFDKSLDYARSVTNSMVNLFLLGNHSQYVVKRTVKLEDGREVNVKYFTESARGVIRNSSGPKELYCKVTGRNPSNGDLKLSMTKFKFAKQVFSMLD